MSQESCFGCTRAQGTAGERPTLLFHSVPVVSHTVHRVRLTFAHCQSLILLCLLLYSHTSIETAKPKKRGDYEIVGGSLDNMEMSFTKKFQSFQNLCFKEGQTVKVSKEERRRLKEAKKAGKLHEELLNRRSKMKADKFCK